MATPTLTESTPLLVPPSESDEERQSPELHASSQPSHADFDRTGLGCLLVQHLSSAWGDRTAEFALYLYLIKYFQDTLLPSSIFGFVMTLSGIVLSHWTGSLVDKYADGKARLMLVRAGILAQKLSALCAYVCCAFMFMLSGQRELRHVISIPSLLFVIIVFSGCILNVSNTCISIAVERDWATVISGVGTARSSESETIASNKLSKLNTYLRQINLLCKLCAPLFVSFLTVRYDSDSASVLLSGEGGVGGNSTVSLSILSVLTVVSLIFELYWIGVVYRRFSELHSRVQSDYAGSEETLGDSESVVHATSSSHADTNTSSGSESELPAVGLWRRFKRLVAAREWTELAHLPVFFSSLSISLLYITVLSFDGIMIGYLKMLSFPDDLVAEMRGISVITGLLGTVLVLPLEKKIGTVRAGNWSIWSMVFSLVPVLYALYVFAPSDQPSRSTGHPAVGVLGAALLFGGMALSRIGLWSFDLIQTKQLQTALTALPNRNALTALQYTMQNVASLLKFALTMVFSRPSQFRWAATASFASVSAGACVYLVYVKKMKGHVLHLEWMKKIL